MSLESGKYYITSADGGFPIGRRSTEDRTLQPKGIFKLSLGAKSVVSIVPLSLPRLFTSQIARYSHPLLHTTPFVQWDVEKLPNGNYRVKNGGDIVGGVDRKLFAILKPEDVTAEATEWTFRLDETRVKDGDAYMWVLHSQCSTFDVRFRVGLHPIELTLTRPHT